MTTQGSKTLTALALGALATALLTGCNSGSSEESADGGVGGTSAAVPSGSSTGSPSAASSAGGEDPAFTAISTVEADGGKVVGLDRLDDGAGGYTVEVLDQGKLFEVKVDSSGKNPEPRRESSESVDTKKLAEATVLLSEALNTAREKVPGKNIDEAEIDDEGGKAVWKIELDVDNQGSSDVLVDAASGAVVQ